MTNPINANFGDSIRLLLEELDTDEGISNNMYTFAIQHIENVMGPQAADVFARQCRATEGRFYLPSGTDIDRLLMDMSNVEHTRRRFL